MTHNEFFEKTDFIELGNQKLALLSLLDKGVVPLEEVPNIDGLINFIDNFQDTAVDNGIDSNRVFIIN